MLLSVYVGTSPKCVYSKFCPRNSLKGDLEHILPLLHRPMLVLTSIITNNKIKMIRISTSNHTLVFILWYMNVKKEDKQLPELFLWRKENRVAGLLGRKTMRGPLQMSKFPPPPLAVVVNSIIPWLHDGWTLIPVKQMRATIIIIIIQYTYCKLDSSLVMSGVSTLLWYNIL